MGLFCKLEFPSQIENLSFECHVLCNFERVVDGNLHVAVRGERGVNGSNVEVSADHGGYSRGAKASLP